MMGCRKTLILALAAICLQLSSSVSGVLSEKVVSAKEAADAAEKGETLDKFTKASSPSFDAAKEVIPPILPVDTNTHDDVPASSSASVAPVQPSVAVEVPLLSELSKSVPAETKPSTEIKSNSAQIVQTLELKSPTKQESESNVPVDSKIPIGKEDPSVPEAKITFPDIKDEDLPQPDTKTLEENPELIETTAPESILLAGQDAEAQDAPNPKIDFYPSFGGFDFRKIGAKRPKFVEEVENANTPQITLVPSSMGENHPRAFVMDSDDGSFTIEQQQQQQQQGFGMSPSASSFLSLFAYPSFGGNQERDEFERRIRLRDMEIERLKMEKGKLLSKLQQLERILAQTNGQEQQRRAKIMMIQQEQQRRRRQALNNVRAHRAPFPNQRRRRQSPYENQRRRRQSPYENYFPSYQPQLHNPFQRYPQFSYPTFPRF